MRVSQDRLVREAILKFAGQAPSGFNLQPRRFIVVKDEANRKRLQSAAWNQEKIGEAPVVVIAVGMKEEWRKMADEITRDGAARGVGKPDKLRRNPAALRIVRAFFDASKPVGAICHGLWTLIDAGAVSGRRLTSYESIQSDLKNAGAEWVDAEVVVDHGLVTSRKPADLPAFCRKLIEEIMEGPHEPQPAARHELLEMAH